MIKIIIRKLPQDFPNVSSISEKKYIYMIRELYVNNKRLIYSVYFELVFIKNQILHNKLFKCIYLQILLVFFLIKILL